jgi:hypothetical protein
VTANKIALETNQDTLQRIAAERGEDWREVLKQRAAEIRYMQELMGGVESVADDNEGADDDESVA